MYMVGFLLMLKIPSNLVVNTHTHIHTHTYARTHTHTHTQAHIHTLHADQTWQNSSCDSGADAPIKSSTRRLS